MAKSDVENAYAASTSYNNWTMRREMTEEGIDKAENTVLSGHFMVSSLRDDDVEGEDDVQRQRESPIPTVVMTEKNKGYDFTAATRSTARSYKFGTRNTNQLGIDASLTKLFECMTLAYSGKLTSPKWKNFKGIKVPLKDKIRLNNIIWREWHMQYIQSKRPIVCQFEPPISEKMHSKPEAVVLEGKYWKRRLESVTAEYKKWRMFYRDKCLKESRDDTFIDLALHMDHIENRRLMNVTGGNGTSPQLSQQVEQLMTDEDFYMDLSDTLFSSLNQPFMFPNPREISQLGNADIIQPGLVQLQPSLDDFMDTLEPLPSLNEMMGTGNRHGASAHLHGLFSDIPTSTPIPMDTNTGINLSSYLGSQSAPISENMLPQDAPEHEIKPEPVILSSRNFMAGNGSSLDPATLSAILSNTTVLQPNHPSKPNIDNASPQVINLVLNSNLSAKGPGDNHVADQPTIQVQQSQFPLQVSSPPTVQQLLAQHNLQQQQQQRQQQQQQQQQQQANKTVTIIQNTSLQALLQGISQAQNQPQIINLPTSAQVHVAPQTNLFNSQPHTGLVTPVLQNNQAQTTHVPNVQLKPEPVTFDLGGQSTLGAHFSVSASGAFTTANAPMSAAAKMTSEPVLSLRNKDGTSYTVQTVVARRESTGSMTAASQAKKDGKFLVPSTTRVPKIRQRPIAPDPMAGMGGSPTAGSKSSHATSKTVLAQLLSNQPIKQETSAPTTLSAFTPIKPAPLSMVRTTTSTQTSTTSSFSMASIEPVCKQLRKACGSSSQALFQGNSVSDFHKNLLIAAASQAIGTTSLQLPPEMMNTNMAQTFTSVSSPNSPQMTCSSPQFMYSPTSSCSDLDVQGRSRHASNESTGSGHGVKDENPAKPFRPKNEVERAQYKELRRASHITAEQKRRGNIKVGFEMLHQLVPSLRMTSSTKSSIANTLGKAADYCKKLKQERTKMHDEAEILKQEIESLNSAISVCQSQLPATGVPVTRQRANQMREMFDDYVRKRTLQNWKFWIFSIIIRSLLDSYNKTVSTASVDDLCRTVLAWLEQCCSLVSLRPTVLNSLRQLCTTTSILSDPSKVPEQAQQAVQNPGDLSEALGFPASTSGQT